MNKIYRVVWNRALGQLVVASEMAKAVRGGSGGTEDRRTSARLPRALLCAAMALAGIGASGGVHAADIANASFEDGTLNSWVVGGGSGSQSPSYGQEGIGASVVTGMTDFTAVSQGGPTNTHQWTVTPYGNYMASLQATSDLVNGTNDFATGAGALGLTVDSQQAIATMLSGGGGNGDPTNASWLYQDLVLNAGDSFTMAWQYVSTDYTPYNDSSLTSLVNLGDASSLATVNNLVSQYALLGATNPGTGSYSTDSFGATGWEVATYSVATAGTYRLGFLSFNLTDEINSPILLIDQQPGQTFDHGVPFNPVAPNEGSGAPTTSTSTTIDSTTSTTDLGSTDGAFDGGTLAADGDTTLDQNFTIDGNGGTIDQAGHQVTVNGAITDADVGGAGSLTITNSGNGGGVSLSGINTYTGTTTIDDGATLSLIGDGSIADSAGVTDNGTFDISGANGDASITTLDGSGTVDLGGNGLDLTDASGTFGGTITGTGGVNVGGGSEALSGANTYTGTTVIDSGATLSLTGDGSIAESAGVTDNGTLDISGANGDASIATLDGTGAVDLGGNGLNLTDASGTFGGAINGTGCVNVGGGSEALSGANTYTGTTVIDSGATLSLTGDGSIADSAGLTDNGTLDVSGANGDASISTLDGSGTVDLGSNGLNLTDASGTFGGAIAGTGGVNVDGGSEAFSGVNTYTGTTVIDGGATLSLTGDGSIAESAGVTDNGTFDISGANGDASITTLDGNGALDLGSNDLNLTDASGTFAGTIGGTGGVNVVGGTEVLSGTNTYTGGTTINNGTVQIGNDANLGDASGGLTFDGGTLHTTGDVDSNRDITLAGDGTIDTAGTLSHSGGTTVNDGTLVLTGDNTYTGGTTINNGTLQIGDDANLGDASGNLTFDGGTLHTTGDVDSNRDITLAGDGTIDTDTGTAMSNGGDVGGSGALIKDGAGTLELAGTLSHSGGTTVNDGTLVLTGDNTYTGGTTLNGGALQIGDDANLGDASGGLTFDGGTLHATASLSTDRQITLAGDGRFDVDSGTTLTATDAIDGTGRLVKQGDGTLVLTGANTYTGGTTIDAGTLQGNSTSLQGDMVDNGTLDFVQAGNGTFGGTLSGTGNLVKDGSGTLTISGTASQQGGMIVNAGTLVLTGSNTYTGGTTVNGGSLQVSRDANLGDASSDLTLAGGTLHTTDSFESGRDIALGGGSFDTEARATFTSNGAIDGTGGLVKNGQGTMVVNGVASHQGGTTVNAGVLILNGANTYTGGTVINGGSLHVSNDANLGDAANALTFNGGDLTITQSMASDRDMAFEAGNASITTLAGVTFTANGDMSGTGSLVKRGGGTLVVSGNNTFSGGTLIDGGVIKIDSGSSLGTGVIRLQGGTLQTVESLGTGQTVLVSGDSGVNVDAGKTAELSGQILTDGSAGCFIKSGKGTLNMTGAAMLSNGTCVKEGMLRANGELTSQVQVDHPGTLRGVGIIDGALNVEGTLAPGNSPGTLSVTGAVTMHQGSALEVDIDGHGTGTGKGNYSRLLVGGSFTAAGALVPTLRGITGNAYNAFTPELGDVYTVVEATGGVKGTFDALQQPTAGLADNTRFQVFYVGGHAVELFVTPASYATLLEGHANGNAVRVGGATDRMVAAQDAGTDSADQHGLLFALAGLRAAQLPQVMQGLAGETHAQVAAMAREAGLGLAGDVTQHLAESPLDQGEHGDRAWATLSQGGYRALSDAQAAGFQSQQSRASAGLDVYRGDAGQWGVGLAHTEARLENVPASGNVRGNGALLYGELAAGAAVLDGSASWSKDRWSTRRADALAPASSLSSQADGHSMVASVTARFPLQHQGLHVEPYVQALWQRVERDGFAESGDALSGLTLDRYDASGTRLLAGLNLGSAAQDPLAASTTWRIGAAVGRDFGDTLDPVVGASLAGESFQLQSPSMGRTLLKLDASGTLRLGKQSWLYGGLNSANADNRASYGVNVGVRVQF
ncbi:autotransporter-associated beta strand repeat-containing protein [Frateuria terrea]|uniref:Autotransporter-associated beta strand repeat-containing protein n=1 Tax=Frateuria terrea TaxID=529704 RepID=A0A1H6ZIN3_9GAMM|nr:autotransporter-associated beta strand repeat-containing protein [Frateuria terrea]SEJ53251.1 autotransporter-associated beta strand repeat-containing protein [Frateuria terrea]